MGKINRGRTYTGSSAVNNGLSFEDDILKLILKQFEDDGYQVEDKTKETEKQQFFEISNGKNRYLVGTQNKLFHYFEDHFKKTSKKQKEVWEKELRPDLFIIDLNDGLKVHMIEVKYQTSSGSVDEKLQTGKFKREMWNKLFSNLTNDESDNVSYTYMLSSWFAQLSKKKTTKRLYYYQDTFDYLNKSDVNIKFWIDSPEGVYKEAYDFEFFIDDKEKQRKRYKKHKLNLSIPDEFNYKKILSML